MHLTTPLGEEVLTLKVGDVVYLNGKVFTARDEAHLAIIEHLREGIELPFEMEGAVIYHCGPLVRPAAGGWRVISAGPTTSERMATLTEPLLKAFDVRALIGKGGMSTASRLLKGRGVYLAFCGGCAALAASHITKAEPHWLEELGMAEAVWELEVSNFGPLLVAVDSHGRDLYARVRERSYRALSTLF
ncbi:FumA C-terminus/TtdB family hydratase beta subunit [Methermicoccus shengliensis]|uniref:Fumarate hydratase n=1 Tax=Methermicoccus shengliensis TaxID=660064 RepID=A0A832VWL3_9EURY|nr:FumA C-terminus/TtdB family hydratase beta subunit [Methermicoccus shengliensis]KUK04646.1 MAG: Fumarase beta subunit [Euryarchaeota archaeon 55_53]KUK30773.1 MAG: Fumarase beta subunit [Methanosarcinales archeaon 56_1174]MDI3487960.1 fumarate hydratase subunit beta [Methanosarcinales archaeon]MDN5295098.1 fumarate hydratase subunit beta [Methanosarcinales archaeon]HIH69122.1 fumarate hydratase [Methermicoccus shengliensis]